MRRSAVQRRSRERGRDLQWRAKWKRRVRLIDRRRGLVGCAVRERRLRRGLDRQRLCLERLTLGLRRQPRIRRAPRRPRRVLRKRGGDGRRWPTGRRRARRGRAAARRSSAQTGFRRLAFWYVSSLRHLDVHGNVGPAESRYHPVQPDGARSEAVGRGRQIGGDDVRRLDDASPRRVRLVAERRERVQRRSHSLAEWQGGRRTPIRRRVSSGRLAARLLLLDLGHDAGHERFGADRRAARVHRDPAEGADDELRPDPVSRPRRLVLEDGAQRGRVPDDSRSP